MPISIETTRANPASPMIIAALERDVARPRRRRPDQRARIRNQNAARHSFGIGAVTFNNFGPPGMPLGRSPEPCHPGRTSRVPGCLPRMVRKWDESDFGILHQRHGQCLVIPQLNKLVPDSDPDSLSYWPHSGNRRRLEAKSDSMAGPSSPPFVDLGLLRDSTKIIAVGRTASRAS